MIKLTGIVLVSFCCFIYGFFKAQKILIRKKEIEQIINMIKIIEIELEYSYIDSNSLLEVLKKHKELDKLYFINECVKNMNHMEFPQAWKEAVYFKNSDYMDKEEVRLLSLIGENFGTTDLKGQLSTLKSIKEQLILKFNNIYTKYDKESKLYQTLGILAGLGVIIFTL